MSVTRTLDSSELYAYCTECVWSDDGVSSPAAQGEAHSDDTGHAVRVRSEREALIRPMRLHVVPDPQRMPSLAMRTGAAWPGKAAR